MESDNEYYTEEDEDNRFSENSEDSEEDTYSLVEFIRENLKAVFQFSDENGYPFFQKSRFFAELEFVDILLK